METIDLELKEEELVLYHWDVSVLRGAANQASWLCTWLWEKI